MLKRIDFTMKVTQMFVNKSINESVSNHNNKKLSYCWETVRRENMSKIAEMNVEMTT